MSKTVSIFKHTHNAGSCYLGKILEDQGFQIRSFGVPTMDFEEHDPLESDLLLIMGSPTGVYQADLFPFINKEIDVIKKRVDADKAVFGICFGSQLIAKALGGDVYPGREGREIGWHDLAITEEAKDHPVRHLDAEHTKMFHWHGDTFDLPEGATLLASSERYKQIFGYGDKVLGLQCHAEIRNTRLQEWYVAYVDDITGSDAFIDIEDLRAQGEKYIHALNRQVEKFLVEWLKNAGL